MCFHTVLWFQVLLTSNNNLSKIRNDFKCSDVIRIIYTHLYGLNRPIAQVGRVFAYGPGDLGSIPGRVRPKTLKMVLDTSLLNTQQYKVCIKDKVE